MNLPCLSFNGSGNKKASVWGLFYLCCHWTPCIKKDTLRMHGQTAAQGELLRCAGTSARSHVVAQPGSGSAQRNGADIQTVQWRWPLGPPRVDGLGEGLYEVRSTIGGRAFRVFFCIKGDRMILLHGIEKKGQKTPKAALDLARQRMKETGR